MKRGPKIAEAETPFPGPLAPPPSSELTPGFKAEKDVGFWTKIPLKSGETYIYI